MLIDCVAVLPLVPVFVCGFPACVFVFFLWLLLLVPRFFKINFVMDWIFYPLPSDPSLCSNPSNYRNFFFVIFAYFCSAAACCCLLSIAGASCCLMLPAHCTCLEVVEPECWARGQGVP